MQRINKQKALIQYKMTGLEKAIRDIRAYFNEYEAQHYDIGIDTRTNKPYLTEARREFTKYWLKDIARFYITNRYNLKP